MDQMLYRCRVYSVDDGDGHRDQMDADDPNGAYYRAFDVDREFQKLRLEIDGLIASRDNFRDSNNRNRWLRDRFRKALEELRYKTPLNAFDIERITARALEKGPGHSPDCRLKQGTHEGSCDCMPPDSASEGQT